MKITIDELSNKKFLKTNSISLLRDASRFYNIIIGSKVTDEKMYLIFDNILSLKNSDMDQENKYTLLAEVLYKVSRETENKNNKYDAEIFLMHYLNSRKERLLRDNNLLNSSNWAIMRLNYDVFLKQGDPKHYEVLASIYQTEPELKNFIQDVFIKAIVKDLSPRGSFDYFKIISESNFKNKYASFLSENPELLSSVMVIGDDKSVNFRPPLYAVLDGVKKEFENVIFEKVYEGLESITKINNERILFIHLLNYLNENNENLLKSEVLDKKSIIHYSTDENINMNYYDYDKKVIKKYLNDRFSQSGDAFESYLEKEKLKLVLTSSESVSLPKKRI